MRWGILLFCHGFWIYLPNERAKYSNKRSDLESSYTKDGLPIFETCP